jgi:hypothetical protein
MSWHRLGRLQMKYRVFKRNGAVLRQGRKGCEWLGAKDGTGGQNRLKHQQLYETLRDRENGVGEGIRTPNTWSHSPVL